MNTKDKRAAMLKKCSCSWDTNITLNATDSQIESGKIVHGIVSFIWNDKTGCWNTHSN